MFALLDYFPFQCCVCAFFAALVLVSGSREDSLTSQHEEQSVRLSAFVGYN